MTKTTLTREALLEKAKAKYEVVDVPEWGTVGIRELDEMRYWHRVYQSLDDNGKIRQDTKALQRVWQIVDQLMVDENTPMFKEEDIPELLKVSTRKLDALSAAINAFNGDSSKKKDEDSKSGSES